jgi:hypothetical protein
MLLRRDRQQIADSTFKITIWISTTLSSPFQSHIPLALPLENHPGPIFLSLPDVILKEPKRPNSVEPRSGVL